MGDQADNLLAGFLCSQPQLVLQSVLWISSSRFCSRGPSWLYLLVVQLCLLPLSSGGASEGVKHSLLLAGWSTGCPTILGPLTSALHIEPPGRIRALAKSSLLKQQTFISHFSYCLIFLKAGMRRDKDFNSNKQIEREINLPFLQYNIWVFSNHHEFPS